MKISRFLALSIIALLVVGAMGIVTFRSFAQTTARAVQQVDTGDGEEEGAHLQGQTSISAAEAEAAALAANPGAKVMEVELEKERGIVVYSVELSNGLEVNVDANSGVILNSLPDDD